MQKYLDKPRLCQFHLKVDGQALLFSQAVLRVDKYEFDSLERSVKILLLPFDISWKDVFCLAFYFK